MANWKRGKRLEDDGSVTDCCYIIGSTHRGNVLHSHLSVNAEGDALCAAPSVFRQCSAFSPYAIVVRRARIQSRFYAATRRPGRYRSRRLVFLRPPCVSSCAKTSLRLMPRIPTADADACVPPCKVGNMAAHHAQELAAGIARSLPRQLVDMWNGNVAGIAFENRRRIL
jgi:hypothetical protein